MKFTAELIEKAKTAKTSEELLLIAKEEGLDVTMEDATFYFANLHPQSRELTDNELENVSGGFGCRIVKDHKTLVSAAHFCDYYVCKGCGAGHDETHTKECTEILCGTCRTCAKCFYEYGGWYCYETRY